MNRLCDGGGATRALVLIGLAAALTVTACGGDGGPAAPAPAVDARRADARGGGLGPDAATVVIEPAPASPDAGAEAASSPPLSADAAAPPADAAAPAPDLAPAPVDAAPAPVDVAPADLPPGPFVPGPSPRSLEIYDDSKIVDFRLTFAPADWQRLLAPVGVDDARWVPCTFQFNVEPVVQAHCRRKGGMADWALEGKPQLLVRFNFVDKMGRFRGLRRLNLEAFDGADAPVRDRLGMWLMREAGIDAPRVNHARVFKDGAFFGLYMNIEALDKEFLEDHYGPDAEANLWEGGEELKTNETINDVSRLNALDGLVQREPLAGDHGAFFSALDAMVDIPQVLREMAAETVLVTNDNFSNGSGNFYYYDHPKRGFVVLPWDLDSILTDSPINSDPFAHSPITPPNKMRQLINQNPAWRQQFVNDVVQIRDSIFTRMPAELDRLCNQIREAVRTDPTRTATFEDFESDCAAVKASVPARIAALKQSLGR